MELRQLESFRVLAETGSFTRAAAALGYVQSTMTAHIQTLEAELGVTLFDRLGKGAQLTDAGRRLLVYCNRILNLTEEMRMALSSDGAVMGTLTISGPETLCIYRLPNLLQEFHARFPEVRVIFRPCRVADLRREVGDGSLDAAFMLQEPLQNSSLMTEILQIEPLVVIAPPGHRLSEKKTVYPVDLADESILLTEQGCSYRNLFEHVLIQAGVYPAHNLEFNSIEAIKQCVMTGMGIAVLPQIAVESELQQGRLIALRWFDAKFCIMSQIIWHKDRWQSPALRAFLETTRNVLGERVGNQSGDRAIDLSGTRRAQTIILRK